MSAVRCSNIAIQSTWQRATHKIKFGRYKCKPQIVPGDGIDAINKQLMNEPVWCKTRDRVANQFYDRWMVFIFYIWIMHIAYECWEDGLGFNCHFFFSILKLSRWIEARGLRIACVFSIVQLHFNDYFWILKCKLNWGNFSMQTVSVLWLILLSTHK